MHQDGMIRACAKETNKGLSIVAEIDFPRCPLVGNDISDTFKRQVGNFGDWNGGSGVGHARKIPEIAKKPRTFFDYFLVTFCLTNFAAK